MEPRVVEEERESEGALTDEQVQAGVEARSIAAESGTPIPLRPETLPDLPEDEAELIESSTTVGRSAKRQPRPVARSHNTGDQLLTLITTGFASVVILVVVGMVAVLLVQSRDSITQEGFSFITSSTWDPIRNIYGAYPAILGTVYTSLLALLVAAPVGLLVAIFLTEIAPRRIRMPLGFVIELLAAVPSIVYGLWALFILVPLIGQYVEPWLQDRFGASSPLFSGPPIGLGYFTAALILAVMILPTITAISRDVLTAVPNSQRDAMLALGATRWETTWKAVVPYARSGIVGAIILALGRAVGETMAVQMVIGNTLSHFNISLFYTGTTLPAMIVNQFGEVSAGLYRSALLELGLILLLVTVVLNTIARLLVWRVAPRSG